MILSKISEAIDKHIKSQAILDNFSVVHTMCGTIEDWNKHPELHVMTHITPAEIYIDKNNICLITSQEWSDWLKGKTQIVPTAKG